MLIAGDAGYSLSRIFEFNIDRGAVSIFPWRQKSGPSPKKWVPPAIYDARGIPKCRHCVTRPRSCASRSSRGGDGQKIERSGDKVGSGSAAGRVPLCAEACRRFCAPARPAICLQSGEPKTATPPCGSRTDPMNISIAT
jgi:hypothetical protein